MIKAFFTSTSHTSKQNEVVELNPHGASVVYRVCHLARFFTLYIMSIVSLMGRP